MEVVVVVVVVGGGGGGIGGDEGEKDDEMAMRCVFSHVSVLVFTGSLLHRRWLGGQAVAWVCVRACVLERRKRCVGVA